MIAASTSGSRGHGTPTCTRARRFRAAARRGVLAATLALARCWQPLLQSLGVYACLDSRGLPNMLPCPCLWHLTWHGRVEHSDVFARAHSTDLAPPLPSPAILAAHVRVHAAITSPSQPRPVTPAVRDYRLSRHKSGVIAEQKCCHTLSDRCRSLAW